jgi:hypothetical protein
VRHTNKFPRWFGTAPLARCPSTLIPVSRFSAPPAGAATIARAKAAARTMIEIRRAILMDLAVYRGLWVWRGRGGGDGCVGSELAGVTNALEG